MKKIRYIQFFLFFLFSCNNSSNLIRIDLKEQIEIFQNKYASNPDTSVQISNNRLLFIKHEDIKESPFEDIHKLIILEKIGNDWGEIKDTILSKGYNNTLSQIQIALIENKEYLYFEDYQPGGSSGNSDLEFTLFDLSSNAKYYIHYTEDPSGGTTWTDFQRSRNLVSNNNLRSYLDEKIKDSKRIYKPDKLEILVKRFKIENEKELVEIEKPYSIEKPVKFKLVATTEELFDIKTTVDTAWTITSAIHNNDFILISRFKGPVLGFNKSTKEYFCVWVPESVYDWINQMEFDLTGNIVLNDRDDNKPNYLINPYNLTYIRLK